MRMYKSDTIAALTTPPHRGALAVIRLSGDNAIAIADSVFNGRRKLTELKGYSGAYGSFVGDEGVIDEGIAMIYRSPLSYTGEDVAELCCHGNPLAAAALLKAVYAHGARPALGGEFTKRAFLNGKMDLSQATAVADIVSAQSTAALHMAVNNRHGDLTRRVDNITDELLTLAATVAVELDYPDEGVSDMDTAAIASKAKAITAELDEWIQSYPKAKKAAQGIRVAIVGEPNAGKSTLMNSLCGRQRSLVSDIAGTTRDVVEASLEMDGTPVVFCDTAGLRESDDPIESMGVELARKEMMSADVTLIVLPTDNKDSNMLLELLQTAPSPIVVVSKSDLDGKPSLPSDVEHITVSALTGENMDALRNKVRELAGIDSVGGVAILTEERQLIAVQHAAEQLRQLTECADAGSSPDLLSFHIGEALEHLYEITGKNMSTELIDKLFADFCVGK